MTSGMKLRAALRLVAPAVLGALTTPTAWAEPGYVIPFTTYQLEQQAVVDGLPCKWISMDGRLGPSYGNSHYDFLCKGGQWATISLYLDRANGFDHGVGKVRLYYREWRDNVHPSAGEAFEAQKFLEYVVNRFVPASAGAQVLQAFWGDSKRSWKGTDVSVDYTLEEGKSYDVHKLEIAGQGTALMNVDGLTIREEQTVAAPGRAKAITARPVPIIPVVTPDAGLLKGQAPSPFLEDALHPTMVAPATNPPVTPVVTDAAVLPKPVDTAVPMTRVGDRLILPPALKGAETPAAKAPEQQQTQPDVLPAATAADVNTAPAPESLAKPAPLPPVSSSLVPDADALVDGRVKAPSNFEAYNKASELTKSVEKRAMTSVEAKPIVTPVAQPANATGQARETLALPPARAASPVAPVATPQLSSVSATVPVAGPMAVPAKAAAPSGEGLGLSMGGTAQPAREPARPLPQLQFVPKAEPLKSGDDVLQFEDEKSGL